MECGEEDRVGCSNRSNIKTWGGGVDTTIKHATVAAGMVAAVMYGGIIVVLLWMNGAMAMMMMTTTPTLQNSGLGGRRE